MTRLGLCLLFTAVFGASATHAQIVRSRPIDQATVRIIGVSGTDRAQVRTGPETRVQFTPALSHGSGVILSPTQIATAAHVVRDLDVIYVRVVGEEQIRAARVAALDEENDVALLQTEPIEAPSFPIPEELIELTPGEILHITGYPLDARQTNPAAASGPLSRLTNDGALEVATSLNPGNSGGPVLTNANQLIGIVSARGRVDRGVQGIALVRPITHVRNLLRSFTEGPIPPAPNNIEWLFDDEVEIPLAETAEFSPLFAALLAHRHWRRVVRRLFDFRAPQFRSLSPRAQGEVTQDVRISRAALRLAYQNEDLAAPYHLDELQAQLNSFLPRGATGYGRNPAPQPEEDRWRRVRRARDPERAPRHD